jgi:hypothetical protein
VLGAVVAGGLAVLLAHARLPELPEVPVPEG